MKKQLLFVVLFFLSLMGVYAQNWSVTLSSANGLPGVATTVNGSEYYKFTSPVYNIGTSTQKLRLTVLDTENHEQPNGNNYCFALSEFTVYDGDGNKISYFASSNADHNILYWGNSDGDGLAALYDNDYTTYFHSMYGSYNAVPEYHYIEVDLSTSISSFRVEWGTRLGNSKNAPIKAAITPGIEYDPANPGEEIEPGDVQGGSSVIEGDAVYVYLTDGGVDAYATEDLDGGYYTEGEFLCMPLKDSEVIYYTAQEYKEVSTVAPSLPEFTSFKFNNKFNPNLHVDAIAENVESNMFFSVNAIGKWLTPSFQLSDDNAVVYVGDKLQESKVTRRSFASPVAYTVTYPGYNKVVVSNNSGTNDSQAIVTEIPLTADMLSTNKPSINSSEGVGSLLDNNSSTIFHSTWGSANDATLFVNTYIKVDLPQQVENIQLYYKCRQQTGYNPLVLEIYASNDGEYWELARTLTYTDDGMPIGGSGQEYTSPTISLGGSYSYLKILQTVGEYSKNHMVLSEMRIYNVEYPVSDTKTVKRIPFGNNYNVEVDWLVDNAISVPRIDIDVDGGYSITSKAYYRKANFRITGYDIYEDFEDSVQIKGRGNTSWSYSKKPYRLKFADKVKPFGLTKGKSWVLLANAQTGSMMANAAAMKIGQMVGAEYTNHIVPVELYINGEYKGSYMFTEHVSMSNNSVDVDEAVGYLLELDSYYDEYYKFKSKFYSMPVNVKEPDLTEYSISEADARFALIQQDYNELDSAVYHGASLDNILDYDAYARFMLTNDLVNNQELGHPKSTFLFKEELENPDSKIKFGPLWDFDWAFGYESTRSYCESDYTASIFKSSMYSNPGYKMFWAMMNNYTVQKYYHKVWTDFINRDCIEELKDYLDCYYEFAKYSFQNNASEWGDGMGYATIKEIMKQWLNNRATYLYNNIAKFNLDEFLYPLVADVNKSNYVTVHDVAITTAYKNGNSHDSFTYSKADVDEDGLITNSDILAIETAAADADPLSAIDYYNTTPAIGELYINNFELVINEDYQLPLNLSCYDNESYKAMQFDITVPDGVMVFDATAAGSLTDHKIVLTQRDMTTYRVLIYSGKDSMFEDGSDDAVVNLTLNSYAVVPEEERVISVSNALIIDEATDELRLNNVAASFGISTNIYDVTAPTASVKGGEGYITIAALQAQQVNVYGVDGRLVRCLNAAEGATRVELPAGIYVVLGSKVIVR